MPRPTSSASCLRLSPSRGGQYNGNGDAFESYTGAALDIYGHFNGLGAGQSEGLPTGSGTFMGTLANNTTPKTYAYLNEATITLHDGVPAPEPSQSAALALGALGLSALTLRARRRRA